LFFHAEVCGAAKSLRKADEKLDRKAGHPSKRLLLRREEFRQPREKLDTHQTSENRHIYEIIKDAELSILKVNTAHSHGGEKPSRTSRCFKNSACCAESASRKALKKRLTSSASFNRAMVAGRPLESGQQFNR